MGGTEDAGPSDAFLVSMAQQGNEGAWTMLYKRYAPVVHGVLLSRVGRTEADDLTQDVFLKAMGKLGDVRDGAAVGGWLIAIARNAAGTRARRPRSELLGDRDCAAPATDVHTDEFEAAERVLGIIRGLPEAYRETLVLRLVEGLTGPQIAARMGMTHGSVRVNLWRGMQLLRERCGGAGECGGECGGEP